MYSHPNMTEEQRRIYLRGFERHLRRHRRYVRVILPALLAWWLSVAVFLSWVLWAIFL